MSQLLESLEDRDTLSAKEFDRALDKLNKRYQDVADKLNISAAAVYQWVHTAKSIPKNRRKAVLEMLVKWKSNHKEEEDEKDDEPTLDEMRELAENNSQDEEIEVEPYEKSEIRQERDELQQSGNFIADAIGMTHSKYYYREKNDTFDPEDMVFIRRTFDALSDIRDGAHLRKVTTEDRAEARQEEISFSLRMLRLHIEELEGGIPKEMALKYLDVIEHFLTRQ